MEDRTQEPSPAADPAFPVSDAGPPWAPAAPARRPGIVEWFLILGVGGIALLALGQSEAALLIAVAGLFIAAQGADLDPAWRRIDLLTSWTVPAGGAVAFAVLAYEFRSQPGLPHGLRTFVTLFSGASALVSLLSGLPWVSDRLVLLWFREPRPTHSLRLAARLVTTTLLFGIVGWFCVQYLLPLLAEDLRDLIRPDRLSGALVGYVVLAFASVGFLVRRNLRATLARLGLGPMRARELLLVPLAVAALWGLNAATEALERRVAPAMWEQDQSFTAALAGSMSVMQAALLGLSAGVGEEITMRGALQPRLGIPLTALLFAALHVQYSWFGLGVIFVIGSVLGVLRRFTSTTVAIAVHALYDAIALVVAMRAPG